MLKQAREHHDEMDTYRANLEAVQGQCIICRLAGRDDWQHSFTTCRQVAKWEYINAKREVLRQTRNRWVGQYNACFHCYQPQVLCSRHEGARTCQYGDLVMQAVYAVYQEEKVRQRLSRRFDL